MAIDAVLDYWAARIEEALKDPDFTLTKFLFDNHLVIEMLLFSPNSNINLALIKCKDFDTKHIRGNTLFYWSALKFILQHPNKTPKQIIQYINNDPYYFEAYIRQLNIHRMTEIYDLLINYCKRGKMIFGPKIIEIILKMAFNEFKRFNEDQVRVLVKYSLKYKILTKKLFTRLIEYGNAKLLIYAINRYSAPTIELIRYELCVNDIKCIKLIYILNQRIKIKNLEQCCESFAHTYKKIANEDAFVHMLLWLDEKQRFSSVKDTILLDFNRMASYTRDFLYDVKENTDVLDYLGKEHEWGAAPLAAQAW